MLKITVIIVTYNGEKWAEKCFSSIANSDIQVSAYAIDNGSKDGTLEIAKSCCPFLKTIRLEDNLGFGAANNVGIQAALNEGTDYIFLLNQDAWVEPGAIRSVVETQKRHADYGILSPVHLDSSGGKIDYNFKTYLVQSDFYDDLISSSQPARKIFSLPFVNAAAWCISRKCLLSVGGFDPLFFLYGEDKDFAARTRFKGFKIGVVRNTYIFHDREWRLDKIDLNRVFSKRLAEEKDFEKKSFNSRAAIAKKILKTGFRFLCSLFNKEKRQSTSDELLAEIAIFQKYSKIVLHLELSYKEAPAFLSLK